MRDEQSDDVEQAGQWVAGTSLAMTAGGSFARSLSALLLIAFALLFAALVPHQAHAMKLQEITTKAGIKAWLVEERQVPLIAMRFAFAGGSSQNPEGKEGVANFLTAMMDEGAGDLDAQTFQRRMEEIAMRMSFSDDKDFLYGSFETLTENRKAAVELMRLVLNKPRFDVGPTDRVRDQLLASLAYAARDPNKVAGEHWYKTAFAGHPYGRSAAGTTDTLKAITPADLEAYRKAVFARDTLRIVLVGDISVADAMTLIDDLFGALPEKATLLPVAPVEVKVKAKLSIVEMPIPQSVAIFGGVGVARKDKDFMPAYVLNHVLGGGGFASRLMEEVREKRGLAYGVGSYIQPYRNTSIFMGQVATKNEEMGQSLDVIKDQMRSLIDKGPTQTELDNAKSFLTGSFALRFDTNSKIANQLLYFHMEGFDLDYVDKRNAEVNAVTLDDVKRVAKRFLNADDLFVTIVGQPKGLQPKG